MRGLSRLASGFNAEPDWLLEKTGLERSVPRKALGVVVVSVLIRADFFVGGKEAEATWGLS